MTLIVFGGDQSAIVINPAQMNVGAFGKMVLSSKDVFLSLGSLGQDD